MELHRSRWTLFTGAFWATVGLAVLLCVGADSTFGTVIKLTVGGIFVALGAWGIYRAVRPFRLHIGPDGLLLRIRKINRLVAWPEIDTLVLTADVPIPSRRPHTSTRLLLVPATSGFEAKLDQTSPIDGKPCLEILSFDEVKESSVAVAEALAKFAGDRFVDTRQAAAQAVIPQEFSMALRGYDPAAVDALIARAQSAIRDDSGLTRMGAKAQFDADLAKGLPIALRGYDRAQVDEVLASLSTQIAQWDEPR